MALKCKVRKTGESLAVTLPLQIAELHEICKGDYVEFTPIGTGEFRITKLEEFGERFFGITTDMGSEYSP